jgi:uncharacterized membrane-anchored protein
MGTYLFDQYTSLHFAVGIVAYFWNMSIQLWIIIHTLFEIFENTETGMYIINNYIPLWPGGKPKRDTYINIFGDTLGAISGWIFVYILDKKGTENNWYNPHIK